MKNIFWIKGNPPASLAVVLCPPGDGQLEAELVAMKEGGVETLVSLLSEDEVFWLGLAEEGRLAKKLGLQFLSHPIPDAHVPPDPAAFRNFVSGLANRLRDGEQLGVHCRGSIGRSTVTAACALIHLGWQPKAALKAIQAARGCPVPDTGEQKEWILHYKVRQ